MSNALYTAAHVDPEAVRGYQAIAGLLAAPEEVFAAPGFASRVLQASAGTPRYSRPGPGRAELVDAIGSPAMATARPYLPGLSETSVRPWVQRCRA
jgi:hypothetical protein